MLDLVIFVLPTLIYLLIYYGNAYAYWMPFHISMLSIIIRRAIYSIALKIYLQMYPMLLFWLYLPESREFILIIFAIQSWLTVIVWFQEPNNP